MSGPSFFLSFVNLRAETRENKMSIEQLAEAINKDCEEYRYFWAYGLVKETVSLWVGRRRLRLLCDEARMMVRQVRRSA
jgi:hypothetical protein